MSLKMDEIRLKGLPLSSGVAYGKVCLFNETSHSNLPIFKVDGLGVEREIARVDRTLLLTAKQMEKIRAEVEARIGKAEAEIFVAQKMILEDPQLRLEIVNHIKDNNVNADCAVAHVLDSYEARLQALDDEYISARASDFGEIKRRMLDLMGNMRLSQQCDEKYCHKGKNRIIVADELTPSLTIDIDPQLTIGFVTERGGINSHAAILARALGIPAVSGLPGIRESVRCGAELIIDGDSGEVIVYPSKERLSDFKLKQKQEKEELVPLGPVKGLKVMANLNLVGDIDSCIELQAEGIGLYRTEFEIIAEERFFSEDELVERYNTVGKAMAGKGVVYRLFDIGSDKALPFMGIPEEENPSLGWRGTRLLLGRKDVLRTQARALARISIHEGGRLQIMYPMIIDVDQFLEIKKAFMESISDINHGQILHGIMFEVPSACFLAKELFEHIDFASIGTNDLTQYFFAVDRNNDMVSYDYNPDKPVFWKMIGDIASAAHDAGKPLSVCGELAGYPKFVAKLMEVGITSVSVSPRRIPGVRKVAMEIL